MIQQYEIRGIVRKEQRETECSCCKNGKLWETRSKTESYYYDDRESKLFDPICNVCLTKYKFSKTFKPGELTYNNLLSWRKVIVSDLKLADTPEIKEEREEYDDTGIFFNYNFMPTIIKTSEGTFLLETCLITRKTKLEYNGKIFLDTISAILEFLAGKGLQHSKQTARLTPVTSAIIA